MASCDDCEKFIRSQVADRSALLIALITPDFQGRKKRINLLFYLGLCILNGLRAIKHHHPSLSNMIFYQRFCPILWQSSSHLLTTSNVWWGHLDNTIMTERKQNTHRPVAAIRLLKCWNATFIIITKYWLVCALWIHLCLFKHAFKKTGTRKLATLWSWFA